MRGHRAVVLGTGLLFALACSIVLWAQVPLPFGSSYVGVSLSDMDANQVRVFGLKGQGVVASTQTPPVGRIPGGASRVPGALRMVDPATAVHGSPQRQGHCSAMLPQGWTMRAGQYGDTADIDGAGGRAHAAWGIRGINTAMRGYYGDMFGPPAEATLATASTVIRAPARYTSEPTTVVGYFTARAFEAGNVVGTSLHHAYAGPAPGQYILTVFLAWADRSAANQLPTAQAVMISIDCQTQLRPPPPSSPGGGPGGRSENGSMKDYNVQLGSQWAHSATGQHYPLDYATQWNDNGPDGPGYYIKSGNSYEKLTPGW
ncbi:MAG: hypothetical protein WCP29_15695 [Acidobacteriota bacterium]